MDPVLAMFLAGLATGGLGAFLLQRVWSRAQIRQAQRQAEDLIKAGEEQAKALSEELRQRNEEARRQALKRFEKDNRKLVQKNEAHEAKLKEREERFAEQQRTREEARNRLDQILRSRQGRFSQREQQVRGLMDKERELLKRYQDRVSQKSSVAIETGKEEILKQLEEAATRSASKLAQEYEQEQQLNLERDAKRSIQVALSRFPRPYCPERGIGNVSFPSPEVKERVLGNNRANLKILEKACGVDITINEEYQSASVLGFDPVRRELGRASLERLLNERNITEKRIEEIVQTTKKELFKKIINDGNRVARDLKVEGLAEEIRHMMGALRYRYSFAQNQHFHCAEVGFLCGLLAGEVGVAVKDARRAGLLHDIGKAMDHSREGGHAVIGADFIEKHGEKPQIVHAVRAHHFDEQPSSDLAYLVIAADAISGARPGARRSTMDSYNQKIADLEKIGSSFEGVLATYILSAGREVRVIVNSDMLDDHQALELSKKIARKIEEECNYPGLIKLTVVRETQAIEMAK